MDAKEEKLLNLIKEHGGLRHYFQAYGDEPRKKNNIYYQIVTDDMCVLYATNLSDECLKAIQATLRPEEEVTNR